MKIHKGDAGYLKDRKKKLFIKFLIEAIIIAALLTLGFMETNTRNNLLTVVAILGCLPAGKTLVELIMVFPHKSIAPELAYEIAGKTELLTTAYDLVLTSSDKIMPIDCAVFYGNMICAYTSSGKLDISYTTKHIRQMLEKNKYSQVTVKIFDNYTAFLSRAEGMHNMAAVDRPDTEEREAAIRRLILNISL